MKKRYQLIGLEFILLSTDRREIEPVCELLAAVGFGAVRDNFPALLRRLNRGSPVGELVAPLFRELPVTQAHFERRFLVLQANSGDALTIDTELDAQGHFYRFEIKVISPNVLWPNSVLRNLDVSAEILPELREAPTSRTGRPSILIGYTSWELGKPDDVWTEFRQVAPRFGNDECQHLTAGYRQSTG